MSSPAVTEEQDLLDFDVPSIVRRLREVRDESLAARNRLGRAPKAPSRKVLTHVVEELSAVLFPNRLGVREVENERIDYFVGHTLDTALRQLAEQVVRELKFAAFEELPRAGLLAESRRIVRSFAEELPNIRAVLETDLRAAFTGDPAARNLDEVLICYPGVTAVIHYRLAHALQRLGAPLIARIIAEIAHSLTGIDIHPGATIGGSFFIDHGTGVVIGETAIVGERVRLYHGVTLGAKRFESTPDGGLVKGNPRHPIVEDDVIIYAGATILGRITIGKGSAIGGNVWLTRSVPPGSQISQAKVRSNDDFDGGSGI